MIRGATLPRIAECRDCQAPIRFVRMTTTGRSMPVNPKPDPSADHPGAVAATLRGSQLVGFVITRDHLPGPLDLYRFRPHYASCEKRSTKSTTTTTHPEPVHPDPALF